VRREEQLSAKVVFQLRLFLSHERLLTLSIGWSIVSASDTPHHWSFLCHSSVAGMGFISAVSVGCAISLVGIEMM
jgi:hypothetical protein